MNAVWCPIYSFAHCIRKPIVVGGCILGPSIESLQIRSFKYQVSTEQKATQFLFQWCAFVEVFQRQSSLDRKEPVQYHITVYKARISIYL